MPVAGLHVDLVRGGGELDTILHAAPGDRWLSVGIVDGRNVWRTDLRAALGTLQRIASVRGSRRLMVAPSCSLLHVPVDLAQETKLDPEVKTWLAFATQKLEEVATLARGLDEGEAAIAAQLKASDAARRSRRTSPRVHRHGGVSAPRRGDGGHAATRRRLSAAPRGAAGETDRCRGSRRRRSDRFRRPRRSARPARGLRDSAMTQPEYEKTMEGWIDDAVRWQEELGLDVLVHGEFERNDMVKYFGEQLSGYAFTQHGWVQSYGSRCVAPPMIWGDVSRPAPMTVRWSAYAQSRTRRPMKGMLTGPVTMLQWSFVRDDVPRAFVCRQIALAIRDEVADLEAAGIPVIQVDEPAFREGLPLRHADWAQYLGWAVACFRLSTCSVKDDTSIHTHMCYSEFNDIMPAIAEMDADAISIETTRSRMELLDAFVPGKDGNAAGYPAEIGPGIWDIHSPRVPDTARWRSF